jgi:acyl carrier protein
MIRNLLNKSKRIEDKITALVKEVVPPRHAKRAQITQDTVLADLGVDSLGKVSLAFRIEEVLGVDLTQFSGNIGEVRTVGDVVRLVREIQGSESQLRKWTDDNQ